MNNLTKILGVDDKYITFHRFAEGYTSNILAIIDKVVQTDFDVKIDTSPSLKALPGVISSSGNIRLANLLEVKRWPDKVVCGNGTLELKQLIGGIMPTDITCSALKIFEIRNKVTLTGKISANSVKILFSPQMDLSFIKGTMNELGFISDHPDLPLISGVTATEVSLNSVKNFIDLSKNNIKRLYLMNIDNPPYDYLQGSKVKEVIINATEKPTNLENLKLDFLNITHCNWFNLSCIPDTLIVKNHFIIKGCGSVTDRSQLPKHLQKVVEIIKK